MKTQLVAALAAFGIASAFAADWSYTESGNIQIPEITENSTITISSGKTVTNTTALVGMGLLTVKGGGTLYLTQPSPDFSGGLYLDVGDVAVTTSGAFGTGTVTLHGVTAKSIPSKVVFDNGSRSVAFDNDFFMEATGTYNKQNLSFLGGAASTVTLSGAIAAPGRQIGLCANAGTIVLAGSVSASDVYFYGATFDVQGTVSASGMLYAYGTAKSGDTPAKATVLRLSSAANRIGTLCARKGSTIHLDGESAAGGAVIQNTETSGKAVYLHGHDQTIASIRKLDGTIEGTSTGDSGSATLTLTGGVVTASMGSVASGAMGLVIDDKGAEGNFTQIQSNGTHTITGPITVKRGTFAIRGAATYKKVPSLAVEGGTLEVATTAASPFAALTSLLIGATGRLKIASGLAMPFPNNQTVDVSFETGAAYEGDDIEIVAKSLTVDGQEMEKGIWTHEDNEAIPEGITISTVSKKIEITESGEIDFAATYGAVDGYWQVTVASGVTVTNTTALAGTSGNVISVSGGGTFVQKVTSPDFASEFRIGKAIVTVVEDRGLGTGRIRISGYSKAGGTSQLAFANGSESIEMPNEIVVLGNAESGNQARAQIYFGANSGLVTFSGDVDASGCVFSLFASTSLAWTTVGADFTGSVTARQITLDCRVYKFHGRVDADELYAAGNANQGATRYTSGACLYSSENRIGYCHARKSSEIYAEAVNVFGGSRLEMDIGDCTIGTNSQTVARLGGSASRASIGAGTGASVFSTLTLTGGVAKATTSTTLANRMNLVIDDCGTAGDFVQVVTNYDGGATAHTMSGTIAVKRGTLRVEDKVTFANVTGVDVSADGALALGSAAVFGTAANVKKTGLTLRVAPEATVTVDDGLTVNVHRCWIGEEGLRAGDYTGAGGPSTATVLPQLSGTGILHVGHSSGQGLMLLFR